MAKNNQKCVRMSDEILKVVDGYRGDGFNEKFENLVADFRDTLSQRKKVLDDTNKMIDLKKKYLNEIEEKIMKMESFRVSLDVLKLKVLEAKEKSEKIPVVSQIDVAGQELQLQNDIQKQLIKNVSRRKATV